MGTVVKSIWISRIGEEHTVLSITDVRVYCWGKVTASAGCLKVQI